MLPFDPSENIRKPLVFKCFQGDQKGALVRKGLKLAKLDISIYIKVIMPYFNFKNCFTYQIFVNFERSSRLKSR